MCHQGPVGGAWTAGGGQAAEGAPCTSGQKQDRRPSPCSSRGCSFSSPGFSLTVLAEGPSLTPWPPSSAGSCRVSASERLPLAHVRTVCCCPAEPCSQCPVPRRCSPAELHGAWCVHGQPARCPCSGSCHHPSLLLGCPLRTATASRHLELSLLRERPQWDRGRAQAAHLWAPGEPRFVPQAPPLLPLHREHAVLRDGHPRGHRPEQHRLGR